MSTLSLVGLTSPAEVVFIVTDNNEVLKLKAVVRLVVSSQYYARFDVVFIFFLCDFQVQWKEVLLCLFPLPLSTWYVNEGNSSQ